MTIGINDTASNEYIGNGTASVFPITFKTFEKESIEASVADADGLTTNLTINTHFTLDSIGIVNTNGQLTLVNGAFSWVNATGKLQTGWTLYIKHKATGYQPMKGRDIIGRFAPEKIESTIDRLAMNVLAIKGIASRALGLQLGDGGDASLPPLAGNANKILKVNATATGFEYGPTVTQVETWKNDAQTAATTATTKAGEASTSASNAATSATNAANSATAANAAKSGAETAKTGAETARDGAGVSQTNAANSANNSATSATNSANSATAAANSATAAANSATAASTAQGFRDQAEAHKNAAALSATNAANSATASASSATDANTHKLGAQTARTGAETAKTAAEAARDQANIHENQSFLWSERILYDRIFNVDATMSPFTIDDTIHQDSIIKVDDGLGPVTLILPTIASTVDQIAWKIGVLMTQSFNPVTIQRSGTDTINGMPTMVINSPFTGGLIYANSPTDWKGKYFMNAVLAADALPAGGILGDVLYKNSGTDFDASWSEDKSLANALIFG